MTANHISRRFIFISIVALAFCGIAIHWVTARASASRHENAVAVLDSNECHVLCEGELGSTSHSMCWWVLARLPSNPFHEVAEAYIENRSREDVLKILSSLPDGCCIRMLSLDGSDIHDDDLFLLRKIKGIRTLWLGNCPHITETGLKNIQSQTEIIRLHINGNDVSDSVFPVIRNLPLIELNVRDTHVTPEGIRMYKHSHKGVIVSM